MLLSIIKDDVTVEKKLIVDEKGAQLREGLVSQFYNPYIYKLNNEFNAVLKTVHVDLQHQLIMYFIYQGNVMLA